jgi:hypothetical protein
MKTRRRFASLLGILALVSSFAGNSVPAVANQASFMSQVAAYKQSAVNFYTRLNTLKQFENSPSTLTLWAHDAAVQISAYDSSVKGLTPQIGVEARAQYPTKAQDCQDAQAAFLGPYQSGLGFGSLKLDYDVRLATFRDTLNYLESKENTILANIADYTLNGKSAPTADYNLLAATRSVLNNLAALYHQMEAEDNYIENVTEGLKREVYGAMCGRNDYVPPTPTPKPTQYKPPTPTPSPQPTPKPTPTPTPAPKSTSKAGQCPGGMIYIPGIGCRPNPG